MPIAHIHGLVHACGGRRGLLPKVRVLVRVNLQAEPVRPLLSHIQNSERLFLTHLSFCPSFAMGTASTMRINSGSGCGGGGGRGGGGGDGGGGDVSGGGGGAGGGGTCPRPPRPPRPPLPPASACQMSLWASAQQPALCSCIVRSSAASATAPSAASNCCSTCLASRSAAARLSASSFSARARSVWF